MEIETDLVLKKNANFSKLALAVLFLGLFFGFSSKAHAATYYVDFASGADSNNGTATGTALQHCPGDANYSPSGSAPTTLAAGDTVIFKGGVSYFGTVTMKWNGSSGNVITYDGNSAGTWGTGRAIIDGENTRYRGFEANAARSYITINNFEIKNMAPNTGDSYRADAVYFYAGKPNNGITLTNCYIHEIGYWDAIPGRVEGDIRGTGIRIKTPSNLTVSSTTFSRMMSGIGIEGYSSSDVSDMVVISGNTFTDHLTWGMYVYPNASSTTFSNYSIFSNSFHDFTQNEQACWDAQGGLGGNGQSPHVDGIFFYQPNLTSITWTNMKIYKNLFYNTESQRVAPNCEAPGTAGIYIEYGVNNISIYNNLFINPLFTRLIYINDKDGPLQSGNAGSGHKILNNSFIWQTRYYSTGGSSGNYPNDAIELTDGNTASIENNIFYHDSTNGWPIYSDASSTPTTLKNNQFLTNRSDSVLFLKDTTGYTISGINGLAYGGGDQSGNPLFSNISDYVNNPQSADLNITYGSPAKDAGLSESSTFADDFIGTSRPQGSLWDIGAYEYIQSSDTTPPAAPTGLGVQ